MDKAINGQGLAILREAGFDVPENKVGEGRRYHSDGTIINDILAKAESNMLRTTIVGVPKEQVMETFYFLCETTLRTPAGNIGETIQTIMLQLLTIYATEPTKLIRLKFMLNELLNEKNSILQELDTLIDLIKKGGAAPSTLS